MNVQLRRLKRRAEEAVDFLIHVLDSIDGDADSEEGGDAEPSLAALERHPECIVGETWSDAPYRDRDGSQLAWHKGARDDREDDHDGAEPDVDDELSGDEQEPSLGSFDRLTNQDHGWRQTQSPSTWVFHCNTDLELQSRR
ncbi:hypothetical protein SAMN05216337_1001146 [Bradyrhizobium brasilense]|uniref:Uncharacterized protein n=1 Tax=Bradyrhizobium brasilense TaxID=1419277 RepID=A0A1G6IHA0_9BRAD|nr:hypothetical protein [Bradyrhizobium brasilense]SDC05780.1 hypothetical protein SAMN05216337_1001146 [Bradyrhizobium brasilense]